MGAKEKKPTHTSIAKTMSAVTVAVINEPIESIRLMTIIVVAAIAVAVAVAAKLSKHQKIMIMNSLLSKERLSHSTKSMQFLLRLNY